MVKDYSQNGESTCLKEIFDRIGTFNKYGVEFGAADGYKLSNLRMFLDMDTDWQGLQIDRKQHSGVAQEFITRENINDVFRKYNVPDEFDLLSIDIDGNDYWVWKEINYRPNVVIIEYNANFSHGDLKVLKYDPSYEYGGTVAYGASFDAMCGLAKLKGYYLYKEVAYTNLIFVKNKFEGRLPSVYEEIELPRKKHKQVDWQKMEHVF